MQKIPTLFVRDYSTMNNNVVNEVTPGCEWVLNGEGVAFRKYDGTCALLRDGIFYKRREIKKGKTPPTNWEAAGPVDPVTGRRMGWVPVSFDAPEDKYFVEAYRNSDGENLPDGTYEVVGERLQGNPEGVEGHRLISHDRAEVLDVPRDFDGLMEYLRGIDFEGIVFRRYPDRGTIGNEMCKIKKRDLPPM